MTHLVLVILAVIWAAVLLPPFLQNRSESRPADSISTFRNQLHVLERRASGGPVSGGGMPQNVRPMGSMGAAGSTSRGFSPMAVNPYRGGVDRARLARMNAKKRRRDILVGLLGGAAVTLLLGLVVPTLLMVHVVIDLLLVGYVALLVNQRKLAEERSMKVRYMSDARRAAAARRPQPVADLALRRTASN